MNARVKLLIDNVSVIADFYRISTGVSCKTLAKLRNNVNGNNFDSKSVDLRSSDQLISMARV